MKGSLVFAVLMIVVPIAIAVANRVGWLDDKDLGARLLFVLSGAFLVLSGNAIPKRLASLAGPDPSRVQSLRRFAGWAWVLTGMSLAIAWIVLPIAAAITATFIVIPVGVGVIALRCMSARVTA